MQVQESALGQEGAERLSIGVMTQQVPHMPGLYSLAQYRHLLVGMMAQGHGIEAVCVFLTLTRDALLDLVVQLDLPTPSEKLHRRSGGPRAWTAEHYPVLLAGWLSNWQTRCIAQEIGKSRAAIWAKSRRLGLPRRERRDLFWPELIRGACEQTPSPCLAEPERSPKAGKLPARWFMQGCSEPVELKSKRNGREVDWAATPRALVEIGMRVWAGQRISKIAEACGVSYRTITSQLHWLQIPKMADRPQVPLVDHYDEAMAKASIAKAYYKLSFAVSGGLPFWQHRIQRKRSLRDEKNGVYSSGVYA